MTQAQPTNLQRRLKVVLIAPSLRYVGGQAVQADLLLRLWQNDPDVDVRLIAVDPPLPRWLTTSPFCAAP